jgi:hypothetical protein
MDFLYPSDNWLLTLLTVLFGDRIQNKSKDEEHFRYIILKRDKKNHWMQLSSKRYQSDIYEDAFYRVHIASKWTNVWTPECSLLEEADVRAFVMGLKAADVQHHIVEMTRPRDEEKERKKLITEYARIEFTARGGRTALPYLTDAFVKLSTDDASHVSEQFSNGQDYFALNAEEAKFVWSSDNPICLAIISQTQAVQGFPLVFSWCHDTFKQAYEENDGFEIGMSYYPHDEPTGLEYLLFHMDPRS